MQGQQRTKLIDITAVEWSSSVGVGKISSCDTCGYNLWSPQEFVVKKDTAVVAFRATASPGLVDCESKKSVMHPRKLWRQKLLVKHAFVQSETPLLVAHFDVAEYLKKKKYISKKPANAGIFVVISNYAAANAVQPPATSSLAAVAMGVLRCCVWLSVRFPFRTWNGTPMRRAVWVCSSTFTLFLCVESVSCLYLCVFARAG